MLPDPTSHSPPNRYSPTVFSSLSPKLTTQATNSTRSFPKIFFLIYLSSLFYRRLPYKTARDVIINNNSQIFHLLIFWILTGLIAWILECKRPTWTHRCQSILYFCKFVCLYVCMYVIYGWPNHWADCDKIYWTLTLRNTC